MEKSQEKRKRGDGGFLLSGSTRLGKKMEGREEQQNLSQTFSGGQTLITPISWFCVL